MKCRPLEVIADPVWILVAGQAHPLQRLENLEGEGADSNIVDLGPEATRPAHIVLAAIDRDAGEPVDDIGV
ncbi:unannotated protein [freshwater metagenome]|uniref:Unannotated protein n=1 Tax=freshwater metagenome TaxID=449393 RepID=A0A6J6UQH9_9ZZZZ